MIASDLEAHIHVGYVPHNKLRQPALLVGRNGDIIGLNCAVRRVVPVVLLHKGTAAHGAKDGIRFPDSRLYKASLL